MGDATESSTPERELTAQGRARRRAGAESGAWPEMGAAQTRQIAGRTHEVVVLPINTGVVYWPGP
jgi:hypothetical protein